MTPMEHRLEQEEERREMAERELQKALDQIEILKKKLEHYESNDD